MYQMHGLRRVGHLDSLILEAPFDLEVDLLDTGEVLRVVEVPAPVGDIEDQSRVPVALEVSARILGAGVLLHDVAQDFNRPLELLTTRVVGDANREGRAARGSNLKIVDVCVDDDRVWNRHERAFIGPNASAP